MDAHPITSFSDLVEPWRGAFLTVRGSLVRAIELGGVDTDSLTETDLAGLSALIGATHGTLHRSISVHQVYAHYEAPPLLLKRRDRAINDYLSTARADARPRALCLKPRALLGSQPARVDRKLITPRLGSTLSDGPR